MLPEAGPYLVALNRLASDRPLALGMAGVAYGRIPFLSIDRYAARHGIDGIAEFARFDRIINAVDIAEVNRLNEASNKTAK